jgi:hypothetical protein
VSRLEEVGARDGWRCWLCDEPVDPEFSVNDPRGPSIDSAGAKAKGKGSQFVMGNERLAHRGCNTRKGAVAPIISWPDRLFVIDPAPIMASVQRLHRKGGSEIMARCPTRFDGDTAAEWLLDRISRLCPELSASTEIRAGAGQFLLVLRA